MEVSFTFRHVESSDAMKDYAREKISKMQKYIHSAISADVVFSMENKHKHCVEVSVRADGDRYAASADSEDMYASIDMVMDKIERQARKSKDATVDRKRHAGGIAQLNHKRD